MATYNGHKNWNHWNVSLWIHDDESIYRLVRDLIREAGNRNEAARRFVNVMREIGHTATPDGAPYTFTTVRAALRGF